MAGRSRTLDGWKRLHARDVAVFSVLFWIAAAALILAWRGTQTRGFPTLGPWGTPLAFAGWLAAVVFGRVAWRREARRRGLPRGTVAVGHALLSVAAAAGVILLLSHVRFWLGVGLCLWIAEEGWTLGLWRISLPASRRGILAGEQAQANSSSQRPLVPDQSQTSSDSDFVTHPAAATSQSVRAPNDAKETPAAVSGESAGRTEGTGIGDEDDSENDSLNVSEDDSDGIDEELVESTEEGLVEEDEAEDLPPPDVSQKWTRQLLPDGSDALSAWHRLTFLPGQSHQTVHLPFCPAFEHPPAVETQIIEGPPGEVKVSRVWGFGARLEVRLAASSDEPSEVLVLTVVQSSRGG
ncbi:MAG: hypothetical protein ACUVQQ_14755 [Thermogutta sp.]